MIKQKSFYSYAKFFFFCKLCSFNQGLITFP